MEEYKNIHIKAYFHSSDSDTSDSESEYEFTGFKELLEEVTNQSLNSEVFCDSVAAKER